VRDLIGGEQHLLCEAGGSLHLHMPDDITDGDLVAVAQVARRVCDGADSLVVRECRVHGMRPTTSRQGLSSRVD